MSSWEDFRSWVLILKLVDAIHSRIVNKMMDSEQSPIAVVCKLHY
jgi:hypothetical protein